MLPNLEIRAPRADERPQVKRLLRRLWLESTVVSRGRVHDTTQLPTLLALDGGQIVGIATLVHGERDSELVTLNALRPGRGIGTALLGAAAAEAAQRGGRRLWLITTNDNLDAVRFYQRRGMRLVAVHRGAVEAARALKPSIPLIGAFGIPVYDELELELQLGGRQSAYSEGSGSDTIV